MKTKYKVIIGVVAVLWVLAFFTNDKDTDVADAESTQMGISTEQETEPQTEQIETELNVDELTEEAYKAMCEEIYDNKDTRFQDTLHVGQYVKLYGYLDRNLVCLETNAFYMTDYDLEDFEAGYYECQVLEKGGAMDYIPDYGETIDIFFDKEGNFSENDFKTGQMVILYGEVIQVMKYGSVYIVPKYMEVVE